MRSSGFTLVELLVVISVAALLAALLFPVFASVRGQARATVCGTRIRNLTTALLTYEAQRGSFPHGFGGPRKDPPPSGYLGNPVVDRMGWWWFNLAEIVESRSWRDLEILRCPSRRQENPMLEPDILCGNYGANWSLCKSTSYPGPYGEEFVGSPLSSTDVPEPGATLLLVDSGYSLISWWHAAEEPPGQFGSSIQDSAYIPGLEINADRKLWPGQTRDAIGGRHPNKTVNVGFVDGHVARKKASELLVEKTGEDDYDYSPLWGPK